MKNIAICIAAAANLVGCGSFGPPPPGGYYLPQPAPLETNPFAIRNQMRPAPPTQSYQAPQPSVSAFWTGKQVMVQTVTYQSGWNCEYNYAGQTIWRVFIGSCPSSIAVQ